MSNVKRNLSFDCGIARARLETWLTEEMALDRCESGGWHFTSEDGMCSVELGNLESRTLGSVSIERTRLAITGDVEAVDTFMHLFTLRFMSAGG